MLYFVKEVEYTPYLKSTLTYEKGDEGDSGDSRERIRMVALN